MPAPPKRRFGRIWRILNGKMFKAIITHLLEFQARRLLKKFKPKIVAVTGSVGKTSTKLAIATVLSERYKVLAHYGSYNTPVALPMAMFDMHLPLQLHHPLSWLKIFGEMSRRLRRPYPYQILVLELGSDRLGDIAYFKKYIHPDIAVVTAVAPEHMQTFGTIETVAQEELSIASFAGLTLINRDDIDESYAKFVPDGINLDTYGTSGVAEYHFKIQNYKPGSGFSGVFVSPEFGSQQANIRLVGEHNIRSAMAAAAVGIKMGLTIGEVVSGLQKIQPVNGRMNLLRGLKSSTLIDDSYNSSPLAAVAALQTLYLFPATQRIAVLGSMNELGTYSERAHKEVGKACDPALLEWVITIGSEAEKYLAPAAVARSCRVRSFASPYDAGTFVHSVLQKNAVVLIKGSQNGVFSEETTKMLLHRTEDESKLVRQTPDWMAIKQKQFGEVKNISGE